MQTKRKHIWRWLVGGFILLLPMLFCGREVYVFITFWGKEYEAVPAFDALNDQVAQTLQPLPAGAVEIERYSFGTTRGGEFISPPGRWLRIVISTPAPAEETAAYYRQQMTVMGWNETTKFPEDEYISFYRDTSCLGISIYDKFLHEYDFEIWHDFQRQTFSPPLPYLDFLELRRLAARCP